MTGVGIRFGIVGCGHASKNHARALLQLPGAELAAACDTDAGALENFTRLYGIRGYLHYEEMLEKEKNLDVMIICTPSEMHTAMGIMAACRGKHVLMEKPMALSLESADRLIKACEKEGVYLSVVLQNRFKPAMQILKLAADGAKFGQLSHGVATVRWNRNNDYYSRRPWRSSRDKGGGVLINQAIHSVDALQWIMGEVDQVIAQTTTRYRPIDAEDVCLAILKFKSGALGLIEAASTVY
ncbi:MAG: Gfo/Idh/MocA family oxidoreductase, partial [Desulfotomaculaceae bacterium]